MVLVWASFVDVHSSIARYEIAVGTSVDSDDAHGFEDVGLQTAATASSLTLTGGLTYYIKLSQARYSRQSRRSSGPQMPR